MLAVTIFFFKKKKISDFIIKIYVKKQSYETYFLKEEF